MTLPEMTPAQRDVQIAALERAIEILRALPVITPCDRCWAFNPDTGSCAHWQAVVPPEARAAGCAEFDESIPF